MGNGPQTIRWIGSRRYALSETTDTCDKSRPVRIMAGALGSGLPRQDLLVSRQHRMLISSSIAARMFGCNEALIAAIQLTAMPGINVDNSIRDIAYFHLIIDRHEVVFAQGAPAESLLVGARSLSAVSAEARQEILTLFSDLQADGSAQIDALGPDPGPPIAKATDRPPCEERKTASGRLRPSAICRDDKRLKCADHSSTPAGDSESPVNVRRSAMTRQDPLGRSRRSLPDRDHPR